jgi:GR25 family glycosyltransferase involved in LPS biosynthesis
LEAYVIGKLGKHRNEELTSHLRAAGIRIIKEDGFVDSRDVSLENVDLGVFRNVVGREPNMNEIACAMAHLEGWRAVDTSDLGYLLIVEDDAILIDSSALASIENLLGGLKGSWVASLEVRAGDRMLTHYIHTRGRFRRTVIQPRGAAAYIISKEAARNFIEYFEERGLRFDGLADILPGLATTTRWYVSLPPVFKVGHDYESLIGYSSNRRTTVSRFKSWVKLAQTNSGNPNLVWGGFLLLVVKSMKYYFSIHFATAWLTRRLKKGAKLGHLLYTRLFDQ